MSIEYDPLVFYPFEKELKTYYKKHFKKKISKRHFNESVRTEVMRSFLLVKFSILFLLALIFPQPVPANPSVNPSQHHLASQSADYSRSAEHFPIKKSTNPGSIMSEQTQTFFIPANHHYYMASTDTGNKTLDVQKAEENNNGKTNPGSSYKQKDVVPTTINTKTTNILRNFQKSNENYRALLALGASIEGFDRHCNNYTGLINELGKCTQDLGTILQKIGDSQITKDEKKAIDKKIEIIGKFVTRQIYRISPPHVGFRYTRFIFTHPEDKVADETLSGLTGIDYAGQPSEITRQEFQSFFPSTQEGRKEAKSAQNLIDAIFTFQNFIDDSEQKQTTNLKEITKSCNAIRDKLTNIQENAQQNQNSASPQLTRNISGTFQVYSPPIPGPGLGLNGAFSFNFQTQAVSFGIGKSFFQPFSDKLIGLVYGLDSSFRFTPANNSFCNYRYSGLTLKGFVGIGLAI